jgi:2-polyprenyl-3-methyl-5-hydroxy-6-metoxy-1,4-benzoquinol methylase
MDQTFDRTNDVSKIEGCNTRGVEYRWETFSKVVSTMCAGAYALDFGAGSLRESYDLVVRGFVVTSIDLNSELLASYESKYDWPDNRAIDIIGADGDLADGLIKLQAKTFDLITCFDVLEHLDDPGSILKSLRNHMNVGSKIFITVPNGRSLFEIVWHIDLIIARATKRYLRPGEPHVQRNSPERWKRIIENSGFSVVQHEMAIGFFVNTFAALIQIPITLSGRILRKMGVKIDAVRITEKICDIRIMNTLDGLDRKTKAMLAPLYGWNLFVAEPARPPATGEHSL